MTLNTYTIYKHPKDHPEGFVTRRWVIFQGRLEACEAVKCKSLDEARRAVPIGLHRVERQENDDSTIVETWL